MAHAQCTHNDGTENSGTRTSSATWFYRKRESGKDFLPQRTHTRARIHMIWRLHVYVPALWLAHTSFSTLCLVSSRTQTQDILFIFRKEHRQTITRAEFPSGDSYDREEMMLCSCIRSVSLESTSSPPQVYLYDGIIRALVGEFTSMHHWWMHVHRAVVIYHPHTRLCPCARLL